MNLTDQSLSITAAPSDEQLAKRFHDLYQRLIPRFKSRESKHIIPWSDVDNDDKRLLRAVMSEMKKDFK